MDKKEPISLAEFVVGLTFTQKLLFQYLIKNGTVSKTEIANALDFLIDDFNKRDPSQAITLPMADIRAGLERDLPEFPPPPPAPQRPKAKYPDWLKGIVEGGRK